MKIVIAGGTGFLGEKLVDHWIAAGHAVVVLSRGGTSRARVVKWDARSDGEWMRELDGADVVVNLAGRSVDCRYTPENMKEMMDSRVQSTGAVGRAIARAERPPRVWLQMSTATIYAHTFGAPNDERTGVIGGRETDAPAYWKFSIDIAENWEKEQARAQTPRTRKVALRTAMVMGRNPDSVMGVLSRMTKLGLGGKIAGGGQYMSWIHEDDFARAMDFLIAREDIDGAVNICAPVPLTQGEFMRALRKELHMPIGLPATAWMVKLGAVFMRTDSELVIKSRRVIPRRLEEAGFQWRFDRWEDACHDLTH